MKMMQKMKLAVVAGALLLGVAYAPPAEAAVIRLDPALQTVGLGNTAQVDIYVDLAAGESTGGYAFRLTWDPTLLDWSQVTAFHAPFQGLGDPFPSVNLVPGPAGSGYFDMDLTSLAPVLPAQGSGFLLGNIRFTTVGPLGTSLISVVDQFGGLLSNGDGSGLTLPTTVQNACVTVGRSGTEPAQECRQTPVPEPGTLSLIGLGVAGLAAAARRRVRA